MSFMNFPMILHFKEIVILDTNKFQSMVCTVLFYILMFLFSYLSPLFAIQEKNH